MIPPMALRVFAIFSVSLVGNLSENLCLGVGHLSILLEVVYISFFFNIRLAKSHNFVVNLENS